MINLQSAGEPIFRHSPALISFSKYCEALVANQELKAGASA